MPLIRRRSPICCHQSVCNAAGLMVDGSAKGQRLTDWTKLSTIAAAAAVLIAAVPATVVTAAPAYADDCGDPGQPPCTGPVPTTDQVVAVMAELTDPNKPAADKTDIVTPGFTPDEAQTIDDHLHRMDGRTLPSTSP
jgi:hypothetical protein